MQRLLVYIIGSFIALLSGSYMIVLITYIVGNVGFYMRSPSMAQYLVEDAQPFDPSIIAPGAALTSGVPMLLNLVVSAVAGAMTVSMGYGTTLIIFVASAVVGLVACFFLTEVGPHAKQKEAA